MRTATLLAAITVPAAILGALMAMLASTGAIGPLAGLAPSCAAGGAWGWLVHFVASKNGRMRA